ncbi:diguanylate cyclase [Alteromonas gracilis]|uniref:diguanylate cyclase n=1 Tax=Alteromonas gracilis TaxID=1479524 RepID=UPI0037352C86
MGRILMTLFIFLIFNYPVFASVTFSNVNSELALNQAVLFTVSDNSKLAGDESWVSDPKLLNRAPEQYLHFKVTVDNQFSRQIPVWFSITFPAMKTLLVSDGTTSWETGDSFPYSSRPIMTPNYHFPSILPASRTTVFSGYMTGEILRYNFSIATPEYFNNGYMKVLQRDMAFFGAMVLLTALCLLGYFASRNLVFLSFATFIFATTFWFFRVFGYAFEILWPNTPNMNDITYAISVYAVLISAFWVIFQTLARENHKVFGATTIKVFCAALPLFGILLWQTLGLDIALKLPLIIFFPYILITCTVIYVEHKRGSDRAKWLAAAMLPVTFCALVLIISALFTVDLYLDPITTFMTGIVMTCFFMVALTAKYVVKVMQRERDAQKQTAFLKSEQASKLEALVRERTLALEETNKTLAELASKDSLTALPNRRFLDLFIDNSFDSNLHDFDTLTIAMFDLDHFKNINDTLGHDAGDEVLKAVGSVLAPLNSNNQVAARYGGEEFAVVRRINALDGILSNSVDEFAQLLREVHAAINSLAIDAMGKRQLGACIGWTVCEGSGDIAEAFRRADKALYEAKHKGRNLIVSAVPQSHAGEKSGFA